ncbi:MAG: hypothetical protein H6625_07545 [Bdellovibrionaceae bacterium]|nr:hypothetical protein [Pseudobdellovibrionaceae bacterium]
MKKDTKNTNIEKIEAFLLDSSGLELVSVTIDKMEIYQKSDGKVLTLAPSEIEEILSRLDNSNQPFLQVNFYSGKKLLLTNKLVGFKPAKTLNLDMNKLPKVVTTPDLISVVEAIEDTLNTEDIHPDELHVLEKVYEAVLRGAEDIGFNLTNEKTWIKFINNNKLKPSA